MRIPRPDQANWRSLSLSILLFEDRSAVEALVGRFGEPTPLNWLTLRDDENPGLITRVSLSEAEIPGEEPQLDHAPSQVRTVILRTVRRRAASVPSSSRVLTHDEFFRFLATLVRPESLLPVVSNVVLTFSREERWRLPLLTSPPAVEDGGLGIGTVTLGGLTLRFEDSPSGLFSAELESDVMTQEKEVRLIFGLVAKPDRLNAVYEDAISKSAALAALFVVTDATHPSASAT